MPHQPALAEAFRDGPLGRLAARLRADLGPRRERGEVRPGLSGSAQAPRAASALLVQRWLLTGGPVDEAYADEVLEQVVLPLLRATYTPSS